MEQIEKQYQSKKNGTQFCQKQMQSVTNKQQKVIKRKID